ncbi:MAG: ATP-binding protein [Sedimentisphaerales bacterium]|jgi:hypothetical protein
MTETKQIENLANEIIENGENGKITTATLETSDRVLSRITDGIYRQPSSAIRELISNAYDADAEHVNIETDAPRFDNIIIRDDGNGLTDKALASLIKSIGGSPKRTHDGIDLGIVDKNNPYQSPGGRKLIGKIGIGLFSVAQLTREFQIITKTKGSDYRTVADITLETHSEDNLSVSKKFKTGNVKIWRVPAKDKKSHGTEINLRNLHNKTKDELQSRLRWRACYPSPDNDPEVKPLDPPHYHIGCVDKKIPNQIHDKPKVPWKPQDSPEKKFHKLVEAMANEYVESGPTPSLENTFDNYLKLIWTLSLEIPVDYISKHPFDISGNDKIPVFSLGNARNNRAEEVELSKSERVRDVLKLSTPERGITHSFEVVIDGIRLLRPLQFTDLSKTSHSIDHPLMFIGKDEPKLTHIPKEIRGGETLSFEAYLFWNAKIVPKEHIGVLIRINDASGTLFDETFMKYQVSEQTRLKQITAEIFVNKGLDAALNIDRESFNYAHPHYQYIATWVHNALRQLASKHKAIAQEILNQLREKTSKETQTKFNEYVKDKISKISPDKTREPARITFVDSSEKAVDVRKSGHLVFDRNYILSDYPTKKSKDRKSQNQLQLFQDKMEAVAKVLEAFGVFDEMSYKTQQDLLKQIASIFCFENINAGRIKSRKSHK